MARFFFHVTNGSTFKDAEGENCSSLEAPRTHAAKIAGELGKDRGYEGRHNRNRLCTYERGKSGSRSGDLDISGGYETVKCHRACHFPNLRLRSRTARTSQIFISAVESL